MFKHYIFLGLFEEHIKLEIILKTFSKMVDDYCLPVLVHLDWNFESLMN